MVRKFVSICHDMMAQRRTSNMLDALSIQKRFNQIQHGCELRENDCLFHTLRALVDHLQDIQDFPDLGGLWR